MNRLLFEPLPEAQARCRVLYVSPLKALAVDVERNLRAPLVGISNLAAAAGTPISTPAIAIRTGDTPANERARFQRAPADILITTPESLFLLLTSRARERLVSVDTVIIDEIHALVPGKRGAHLALSLERLEALRVAARRSRGARRAAATHRPVGHAAAARRGGALSGRRGRRGGPQVRRGRLQAAQGRLKPAPTTDVEANLHDEFGDGQAPRQYRPVTIVDASDRKPLEIRVEVPVEDMGSLGRPVAVPSGPASQRPARVSIWASIYPRLLELIRSHRSTLLFVNSRRLAERLAGALNDLAEEPLVRSHHGSLAREARSEVEDLLKAGRIRALVATSSLELGIDMGAIDLVVQIESPPSVASGLQRIGRAGHQVGAASEGVIFPKFRGDLVACAAVARAMHEGKVESTRYPRNPLDVLAQQLVAIAGLDPWNVDDLYRLVRRAAPFADLGRRMFDGVLDMLSGRYPSDEFAELRPRVTWDRVKNTVVGREGAVRVAIANAGTIPDRGLYGVFLAGAERPTRVGELDEEMVFETEVGDTFTLGASTWRVEDITHDRVLVSPAPGEPGKMPFWHGDQAGRPVELGLAIGKLVRELGDTPKPAAVTRLTEQHGLDRLAAENLLQYLDEQAAAGGVPDDRTLVIERCLDELGDWRVCVLSPLGSRIHAPWAMAVTALVRSRTGVDVEVMWGDEGFVVRFPETEQPPDPQLMLPDADEVEGLVLRQLGSTSLFAARFRETAGARAAAAPPPRRPAHAALPAAQARVRSAGGGGALRVVPDRARDLPRGAARSLRHAGAGGRAAPDRHARAARHDDRLDAAVAVCGVAALQLRRQLHLRRRRAAGGAARAGAVGGPGAAARAARRRRTARSARSRCARRHRTAAAAARRGLQGAHRRRHPRSAAAHRRPHDRGDPRALGVCRRRRRRGRAGPRPAHRPAAGRRPAALRGRRRRRALPGCAGRARPDGPARVAPRAGARCGGRPGDALRAIATARSRRRRSPRATGWASPS